MKVRLMDGTTYEGVQRIEKIDGVYYIFFMHLERIPSQVPSGAIQAVFA